MHIFGVFLSLFKFDAEEQERVKVHGMRCGPNYAPLCCTQQGPSGDLSAFKGQPLWAVDHKRVQVGKGRKAYDAAKQLLTRWGQFQLGWAEVVPSTPIYAGAPVCVVAKPLFLVWVANPLKIMYVDEGIQQLPKQNGRLATSLQRFQFAQGCLGGHLLAGEERFALEWDKSDDSVWFDIFTISRPAHPFSLLTYPLTRYYQNRFKEECTATVVKHVQEV